MTLFAVSDVSDPRWEVEGLREVTVASPALARRADLTIWAPRPEAEVPLVVLLHGVYGSHWGWIRSGGAHRTLDRLIQCGRVRPMALAVPSDGLWGLGSGYVPRPGEDSQAWIVDEVPAAARLAAPGAGAEGVCIAGLSMGGFGALRLAGLFPERYAAAAGLSSITAVEQLAEVTRQPVTAFPTGPGEGRLLDVLIRSGRQLPPISLACGTEDRLLESNRHLHRELVDADIDHVYHEHPGGHNWAYWSSHIEDVLVFFENALSISAARCVPRSRGGTDT